MDRNDLLLLSKDDLIALVLAQAAQIGGLMARVGELEARLGAPPKTPDNSSTPPSRSQKPNHPGRPGKPRCGRPGVTRALAADPDRILEATLDACPHCACWLGPADLPGIHAYDHIDLPPVRPTVTRPRSSIPTRAASSPARRSPRRCPMPASRSAWTAAGAGWTTCSSNGCGGR